MLAQPSQSILDPAGPQASAVAGLWWLIFAIAVVVFAAVMIALAWAVVRKSGPAADRSVNAWVSASVAGTVVVLLIWLVVSVRVGRVMSSPVMSGAVTINLVGRQWWWQLEYVDSIPANRFRTANEMHIPIGRPVVINVTSRDVIHSLWVPNLQGKRDLIPGYTTSLWLQADREGIYRGQCAEFCGHQHAHMAIAVRAEAEADFQKWMGAQRAPAVEPANDRQRRGRDVFLRATCPQCHAIQGTVAAATFAPDLTHVGGRATIAAGTLANTPENLMRWIRNSQDIKPGNKMPPHDLNDSDLAAVADYLSSLK